MARVRGPQRARLWLRARVRELILCVWHEGSRALLSLRAVACVLQKYAGWQWYATNQNGVEKMVNVVTFDQVSSNPLMTANKVRSSRSLRCGVLRRPMCLV
jgi:hypothetical protein